MCLPRFLPSLDRSTLSNAASTTKCSMSKTSYSPLIKKSMKMSNSRRRTCNLGCRFLSYMMEAIGMESNQPLSEQNLTIQPSRITHLHSKLHYTSQNHDRFLCNKQIISECISPRIFLIKLKIRRHHPMEWTLSKDWTTSHTFSHSIKH